MKGRFILSLLIVLFATTAAAQTTSHRLQSSKHPDVSLTSPSNGQCLVYVSATGKWTPSACATGTIDGSGTAYYLTAWSDDDTLTKLAALGSSGNPLVSAGAGALPAWLAIVLAGGTNTFSITNGTASLDVAAGATLNIDKSLQVATGAVVINGNAGGSSVLGLPNQTVNLTTMTNGKLCGYNSTGTAIECDKDAGGTGDVTGVGDCTGGDCLDGSSDGGTYIRLYDGNSHYSGLYAGDSTVNLSFYLPPTAGATGGIMYFSEANKLANLAAGTAGYVLKMGASVPEWSNSLSVQIDDAAAQFKSATASKGTLKVLLSGSTDGKLMTVASAHTDDRTITLPNVTGTLAVLGANTFTALQTYDATAGIQVGATGVGITSDDDGAITFTGKSAGYDEDLTLNFDDTENTVVVSSSTGVTKIDFSALNLATTGIITGAVNTNSDANGMSSSEMTAAGMYGTMFWATGAGTWNLPGAATGMSFCVYSTTAAAIVINPDDGDTIVLNGTALSAGDSITSASGAGDFICLLAKDANTWYTLGRSGTWTDTN